jgi:hypothetical protein
MGRRAVVFAVLLVSLAIAASCAAKPANHILENDDKHALDISIVGHFYPYIGGGVIVGIPVAPYGFSGEINDGFYIEVEAGVAGNPRSAWDPATYILGGVRYQVFILTWLAPYIGFRGGVYIPFLPGLKPRFAAGGGLGAFFLLSDHFGFRVEVGYGARAGFTFLF